MYENKILNEVEKEVVKYLREINTINSINQEEFDELDISAANKVTIAQNDISEIENILQHVDLLNPVRTECEKECSCKCGTEQRNNEKTGTNYGTAGTDEP